MSILNERIKLRRLSLNLTLLEVAEYLGVKEATVQRYESGNIKNIKYETIIELAKLLKCSPSYLMGWNSELTEAINNPLSENEQKIVSAFRSLNNEGKRKLLERADELLDLGYVEKGDGAKMA